MWYNKDSKGGGYMTYFNNPYSQQAFQGQMIQPSMIATGYNQYSYGQPLYAGMQSQQPINYGQMQPKVDFQGVIVNSFDDVRTYPVPLGGTVMLLNKSASKFYLKSLGDNGVPVIETYDFSVSNASNNDTEQNKTDSIADSFSKLEDKINNLANRMTTYEKNINSN